MDRIDLRILTALQNDPTLTVAAVGEKVGISHTPCWRRIKKLEDDGIIQGRALILDPKKIGFPINVFAEIRLKKHESEVVDAFEQSVQQHEEIVECHSMSGKADFLIRVLVQSVSDYEDFLKRILLQLPGVGSVNSRFALNSIKCTTDLPLSRMQINN